MNDSITIHLQSTFEAMLTGKFYFFIKKSLWRLLACSALIAVVQPQWFGSTLSTFIYLFGGFVSVSIIGMYLSSKYAASKNLFDADVEFTNDKITIKHRNKNLVEEKDWLWIKALKSTNDYFVLELNQSPSFVIHFSKSKLSQEQIDFFENREVL